jgi:hypothetical protein
MRTARGYRWAWESVVAINHLVAGGRPRELAM